MEKNLIQVWNFRKNLQRISFEKKIPKGILCKLNPFKNSREFFCKFFCWRSPINLWVNYFKNLTRQFLQMISLKKILGNYFRWNLAHLKFRIEIFTMFVFSDFAQKKSNQRLGWSFWKESTRDKANPLRGSLWYWELVCLEMVNI